MSLEHPSSWRNGMIGRRRGSAPIDAIWRLVIVPAVAVLFVLHSQAQSPRARIDVSALGPQVGERVPDFQLSDQSGRAQTLQTIMGRRGAMLVFIRSADW
jgi:cytochrome oxidase Cu insertion factor (SCO1/SenC/PrrC family)